MYTEEPRRSINWGSVIKKGLIILFVAITIFLIIWLFTRNNNSNAVNVDYENNNNNNSNSIIDTNTYSEIFIDNYRYFHDTAKEYFLIGDLPTKGNTIKYTLQDLINKNIVLPFGYTAEATCDTIKSYVSVTNIDGTYTMTTNLVCGKEEAYTKIELGCNQLCENGKCTEETVLEYQYKQAYKTTETTYSCASGYTKTGSGSNTKCVLKETDTVKATKNVTYSCPSGYTKTGEGTNTKCYKDTTNNVDATKTVTYICPSGYTKTGSGSNTKCYKNDIDEIKMIDSEYYTCPSGYTASGSGANMSCTKKTSSTVNATATTKYTCASGTLTSDNKCKITTPAETTTAIKNTTTYCPSGYSSNGNSCVKYVYAKYSSGKYLISNGVTYTECTGGQNVKHPCSDGSCSTSSYMYVCTKGVESTTTYSCPTGYTKSGSGANTTCTKDEVVTYKSATSTTTYSCAKGTLTSGNKCSINNTEIVKATKNTYKNCPSGYTQNGSVCQKTNKVYADASIKTTYNCANGILSGTKCLIGDVKYTNPNKTTTYTCNSGYTKVGAGSDSTCTKSTSKTVDATKSTKSVTKYKYQWSTKTSLDGWTKTGKTRNLETSSK